jgi:DNA-binding transcriptional LysR family regulator
MSSYTVVNITDFDLNLLLVLEAVLELRSATLAAARLHVTPSAVSNALGRLRRALGDPLFVRTSHGLVPTPAALALAPALEAALRSIRGLLAPASPFDPATTTRAFAVACVDVVQALLLPGLARQFERTMPRASLRLVTLEQLSETDGLATGEVDLMVGIPPSPPADWMVEKVYDDPLVAVVDRANDAVGPRLTLDVFTALPHLDVSVMGHRDDRVDRALGRLGRERRVALSVPHFLVAPAALVGTSLVAVLPRRLARRFEALLPLRLLTPPVPLAPIVVRQMWHARAAADPATALLRRLVRQAARQPAPPSPR